MYVSPLDISIHAPTRGATIAVCDDVERISISIHAPTRGATKDGANMGCGWSISIHAPTRGATNFYCQAWFLTIYFNPRSHKGSDMIGS